MIHESKHKGTKIKSYNNVINTDFHDEGFSPNYMFNIFAITY